MASQSDFPPGSEDAKTQNPASQVTESTADNLKDAKADPPTEKSPPSVFVNSEPIREDQVQNAVKFLSHPKVRGSPVMYRRSFLERKGLTKEEIDEAFRRVPDPTPSVTSSQPVGTTQDGQTKPPPNIQPQGQTQTLQPVPSAPSGSISKMGTLSRFHWSHALLAVGLLAVSGAGTAVLFKNSIIPRFKSWIRKVVFEEEEGEQALIKKNNSKPSLAEEAAAAAKAAAAAAADVARTSQEVLISKAEEKKYFQELTELLGVQIHEMRSMSSALHKLEGQTSINGRITTVEEDDRRVTNSRQSYGNGKVDTDVLSGVSGISSSPATSIQPSAAPHPKSYMEIMAMVQRGEKPPNIREINDQPPNPNQPVPNPRLVPKPKPWEVPQSQNSSSYGLQYPESGDGSDSRFVAYQHNGEGSTPWQQQSNARITEIETEDSQKSGSTVPIERPVLRSWVPPQPPPVAMAEAAAAIRQPKKPVTQREQLNDDQLLARSAGISDELERITKISESGFVEPDSVTGGSSAYKITTEIQNGDGPAFNTTEIQNEEGELQIES